MLALAAAFRLQLRVLRADASQIQTLAMVPLFAVIFLQIIRYADRTDLTGYAVLAPVLIAIWALALQSSGEVVEDDRWQGTIDLAVASPTPFAVVVLGRVLAVTLVSLFAFVEVWLVSWVVFGIFVEVEHAFVFGLTVLFTAFAAAGTATIMASLFIVTRSARTFQNSLSWPFYVLGGVLVPVTFLPDWLEPLSAIVFLSWSADLLRASLAPEGVDNVAYRLGMICSSEQAGSRSGLPFLPACSTRHAAARRSGSHEGRTRDARRSPLCLSERVAGLPDHLHLEDVARRLVHTRRRPGLVLRAHRPAPRLLGDDRVPRRRQRRALAALGTMFSIASTSWERWQGTLPLLVACPTGSVLVFLGRSTFWIPDAIASSLGTFFVCAAIFDIPLPWPSVLLVIPLVTLVALSTYCLGIFLGGLVVRNPNLRNLVANLTWLTMAAICGVNVPLSFDPEPLRWLANGLPLTHGLQAIRGVLDGDAASAIAVQAALEGVVGAVFLTLAFLTFDRFAERGRRDGTIEFAT